MVTVELESITSDKAVYKYFPENHREDDPKYTYVQPGYEIQDIYLEWKIFFWHGGLTDNHT